MEKQQSIIVEEPIIENGNPSMIKRSDTNISIVPPPAEINNGLNADVNRFTASNSVVFDIEAINNIGIEVARKTAEQQEIKRSQSIQISNDDTRGSSNYSTFGLRDQSVKKTSVIPIVPKLKLSTVTEVNEGAKLSKQSTFAFVNEDGESYDVNSRPINSYRLPTANMSMYSARGSSLEKMDTARTLDTSAVETERSEGRKSKKMKKSRSSVDKENETEEEKAARKQAKKEKKERKTLLKSQSSFGGVE